MPSGKHYYGTGGRRPLKRKSKLTQSQRQRTRKKQKADEGKMSICGAPTRAGKECRRGAGWGTSHIGIGRCKYHLGNTPSHRESSIKQEAVVFMGAPKNINALDA